MRIAVLESKFVAEQMNLITGGGHTFVRMNEPHDAVLVGSYSQYENAKRFLGKKPMINYLWDIYEWALTYPKYNYNAYRELLEASVEIWTPSQCTTDRLKEFWGLDSHVVLCAVPYFDHEVRDDRFVLQPLREIPDKWVGWTEQACKELGIPCVTTDHTRSQSDFHDLIASCSFVVSGYYEASTGGLSAMEAYYLGKPVIGSGSPYCGLRDYLGDRIPYFSTYTQLRDMIQEMWHNPIQIAKDHKEYISLNFSEEAYGKRVERRLTCVADKIFGSA